MLKYKNELKYKYFFNFANCKIAMKSKKDKDKIFEFLLSSKKNITILTHTNPDGDAIGSGIALKKFLEKLNHKVDLIVPDIFPEFLNFLPFTNEILIYKKDNKDKFTTLFAQTDCFICVDINNVSRLNSMSEHVEQFFFKKSSIVFDHHVNLNDCFTYYYWEINVSSTAELVYDFISASPIKIEIDKDIADCIFTGIMTDTGSFSYSCNYPKTFEIVADLIRKGVNTSKIHNLVYHTFSEDRVKLIGNSLFNKLIVDLEKGGAYIFLSKEDLKQHNYQVGDTEGLVNFTLNIKGIKFGALLTEMDDFIKISFRSKDNLNVDKIASEFFNGGGHKNASGANFKGTLEKACEIIENIIQNHI